MKTVTFTGLVLPLSTQLTLGSGDDLAKTKWPSPDHGDIEFAISVKNCHISVLCNLPDESLIEIAELHWRALDLVKVLIDITSFSRGCGMMPFLLDAILPDGNVFPLRACPPEIQGLCTSYKINSGTPNDVKGFSEIFKIVGSDPDLFLALNDLTFALIYNQQSVTQCARSMDGLRRLISKPSSGNITAEWRKMRETLNVNEVFLKFISEASKKPRHADRSEVPQKDISEVLRRSWMVMNRYLEMRRRNLTQLPLDEFPLLVG